MLHKQLNRAQIARWGQRQQGLEAPDERRPVDHRLRHEVVPGQAPKFARAALHDGSPLRLAHVNAEPLCNGAQPPLGQTFDTGYGQQFGPALRIGGMFRKPAIQMLAHELSAVRERNTVSVGA